MTLKACDEHPTPSFGVFVLNNEKGFGPVGTLLSCAAAELGFDAVRGGLKEWRSVDCTHRIIMVGRPKTRLSEWCGGAPLDSLFGSTDWYFHPEPTRNGRGVRFLEASEIVASLPYIEYSYSNADYIAKRFGRRPPVMPLGFSPTFSTWIGPRGKRTGPVVFVGLCNERRRRVVEEIRRRGVEVQVYDKLNKIHGERLNELYRTARALINVRHGPNAPLETFRLAHALNSGCPVISEATGDPMEGHYDPYVFFARYDKLPDVVESFNVDRGLDAADAFRNLKMETLLGRVLNALGVRLPQERG